MKWVSFIFIVLLGVSFVLGGTENTPGFDNQQFYGVVLWDVGIANPVQVVVKTSVMVYSSAIKDVQCGATSCNGKYGYNKDNIVRVQATNGESITFFVDLIEVKKETYTSGNAKQLDLSIASVKVTDTGEVSNQTSNNTSGNITTLPKKYYYPVDDNTKPSSLVVADTCKQNWDCGAWSACSYGTESRSCFRSDTCDVQLKEGKVKSVVSVVKPSESRSCVMPISAVQKEVPSYTPPPEDNYVAPVVQKPAVPKKESVSFVQSIIQGENFNYYLYGVLGFLGLVGIGIGVFFFTHKGGLDEGTKDELEGVYSSMEQKGLTDEQITSKLIGKGWDESALSKFLKKR